MDAGGSAGADTGTDVGLPAGPDAAVDTAVDAAVDGWVTARTGTVLSTRPGVAELALRRNPKRAHLLVSLLLGKHVPRPASAVLGAAGDLGTLVREALGDASPFVVGFAETATALGHGVAAVCGPGGGQAPYAHTTRRLVPDGVEPLQFAEEHSHAVEQTLGVLDESALADSATPLVLVDDELSTGRTAVNAIRVLQARWPRERYVLASLFDVRPTERREATVAAVADLGATLVDVSLVCGLLHLPGDLTQRAADLVASAASPAPPSGSAAVRHWRLGLPSGAAMTGAFGWDDVDEQRLHTAVRRLATALEPHLTGSVLVLGDEEFMYAAQLTADALGAWTSSTTRSPALVVDEVGYPLRTVLTFPATDDHDRAAFAYNVAPSRHTDRGTAPGFDSVVLVSDRPVHAELCRGLAAAAASVVHVVQVGHGWDTDLSGPS